MKERDLRGFDPNQSRSSSRSAKETQAKAFIVHSELVCRVCSDVYHPQSGAQSSGFLIHSDQTQMETLAEEKQSRRCFLLVSFSCGACCVFSKKAIDNDPVVIGYSRFLLYNTDFVILQTVVP